MKARAPTLLVAAALFAGAGAASAAAKKDSRKKKSESAGPRAAKASTPRLTLDADSFRAAGKDAQRSLSRLGDATAGDRRKLGSFFGGLTDSLRDAWNRFFGPAKKKS